MATQATAAEAAESPDRAPVPAAADADQVDADADGWVPADRPIYESEGVVNDGS